MAKNFKPKDYNSVSPYFIVGDAAGFISLMREVFNAVELSVYNRPDGSIMHAEMRIDDSVIMIGSASSEFPAVPMVMHVYVKDVDAMFRKAVQAGCRAFEEPKQREGDSDRRGTFIDIAGNMWSVATQQ